MLDCRLIYNSGRPSICTLADRCVVSNLDIHRVFAVFTRENIFLLNEIPWMAIWTSRDHFGGQNSRLELEGRTGRQTDTQTP